MRQSDEPRFGFSGRISVVAGLIIACIGIYIYQLALTPEGSTSTAIPGLAIWKGYAGKIGIGEGEVWRLVTYGFVHGGIIHLICNMVGLFFIGKMVQETLPGRHLLGIFLTGSVLGGICFILGFPNTPVVGASAGVGALAVVAAMIDPHRPCGVMFLPGLRLSLSKIVLGFLILDVMHAAVQLMTRGLPPNSSWRLHEGNVASLAHIGGALGGWIYGTFILRSYGSLVMESERREKMWREHSLERETRREQAWAAGRRASNAQGWSTASVSRDDDEPQSVETPPKASPGQALLLEVDALLDKANELGGIEHLSAMERDALTKASKGLAAHKERQAGKRSPEGNR